MKVTTSQLTKIHLQLTQLGLIDEKKKWISDFTNGRETSSKNMRFQEAASLIAALSTYTPYDALDRMRRKVFALAYEAGIIYGNTPEDKRMNTAKLSAFILKSGTVKKDLNKMNSKELVKTINQFEEIVRHKGQTAANKAARSMLDELRIPVMKSNAS